MPVTKLMALAQLMPTKKQDVSRMLTEPTYAVCADLQPYLNDLLKIIIEAKEDGTNGPEVMEVLAQSNGINIRPKKTTKSQDIQPLTEASQNEMGKDQPELLSTPESQAQHLNLNNCPLSAEKSTFWGGVIGWNQQKKTFAPEPKFVLPLPELMSEVSPASLPVSKLILPVPATPSREPVSSPHSDLWLLIRQQREVVASKKRKAEEADLDENHGPSAIPSLFQTLSATNDDSPKNRHIETTENSSGADTPTKEERRKRRKEEKKLKKALEEQQRAVQAANYEPFDYTTAPSVLNAPRTEDGRSQHVLDPFKRALDAPKGLPKRQKEAAGKSATWSG
jgi:exosome complex exonuclease RRP6